MSKDGVGFTQVITWVLVVFGWLIISRQNDKRETRKEIRQKIDMIKRSMADLENSAVEHHTAGQTAARCMLIKREIVRLGKDLSILAALGLPMPYYALKISRIRQSITLKNFDSISYAVLLPSDSIIADIADATDELRAFLEFRYADKFARPLSTWIADIFR